MTDEIRVILIDPDANTRQGLQRQVAALEGIDLVEVGGNYANALARVAALTPEIAMITVNSDGDLDSPARLIEAIADQYPSTSVIAIGSDQDPTLILSLIRAGAREFLPTPFTPLDLIEAIQRLRPRTATVEPKGPRVIAVTGAAGGIGCSSLAVNLASALVKLSRRDTVVVDFDLLAGSLEESLAVIPDNSLEVLVRNIREIDGTLLKRWLPRHHSGLYVLPHPVMMEEAVRIDPHDLREVVSLLRDSFSTVVIDTSKGLQATDFVAFDAADVILVVLQLNLNCVRNTLRLIQYLRSFEGYPDKIRLVVNRLNSPLSEIGLKKAEEILKCRIHWTVANATKLFMPARIQGLPIDEVEGGAGSKAHLALTEIARELQPFPPEAAKAKKRLFSRFSVPNS